MVYWNSFGWLENELQTTVRPKYAGLSLGVTHEIFYSLFILLLDSQRTRSLNLEIQVAVTIT